MSRAIEFARHGGKVLLFGVPPAGEKMTLEAFQIFRKGLTILSSFTSLRNSYQALDCLMYKKVCVDEIVSHRLPWVIFRGNRDDRAGLHHVKKVMLLPNPG
jgi:threonine dehydrogenase-like Zn-dependent dehydrogenase